MDAHLAVRKLMLRIPLGRERVASDSLFWDRKMLETWCEANKNFEEILARATCRRCPFVL